MPPRVFTVEAAFRGFHILTLLDTAFAIRNGNMFQSEVVSGEEWEDEGDIYESIEEIWPDYPTKEDFLFNEDEY